MLHLHEIQSANLKVRDFLALCVLWHWLKGVREASFCIAQVYEALPDLASLVSKQRLGAVLGKYHLNVRHPRKKPSNAKLRNREWWVTKNCLELSHRYTTFHLTLDQALSLKCEQFESFSRQRLGGLGVHPISHINTKTTNPNTNIQAVANIDYPPTEISYFNQQWMTDFGLLFTTSYQLVNALLKTSRPIGNGCLTHDEAKLSTDGYLNLHSGLISKMLMDETVTLKDVPATSVSRLMGMVAHPTYEWGEPREPHPTVHTHHTCRRRCCINPHHLIPMKQSDHYDLHRMAGEAVPTFSNDYETDIFSDIAPNHSMPVSVLAHTSISNNNISTGVFYV